MKIYIKHIVNTFNYGSLMMAINTISYINSNIDNVKFYVDCNSDIDLDRLKKETGISNIDFAIKHNLKGNNIFTKIIKRLKISKIEGEMYDLKIILGGDDISEYYGKKKWLIEFPIMFIENMRLTTILLGQTIGPFTGYRKWLARFVLNKLQIYTRDDKCLNYIQGLGVKKAHKGRDLAFLQLPMQEEAKWILDKYKLVNDNYVTLVISGLTKCYTDNYSDYLNEQYKIIKKILANEKLSDKKIVLLAHVKDTGTADKTVIIDIQKMLTSDEDLRIIAITEDILASEAREILANGFFTITGRMHAAVSTFYMRKPAISISYSVKYEGVIGTCLDLRELIIEASDKNLWSNAKVSEQVAEKIEYIIKNYDELIRKIDENVTKTNVLVNEEMKEIVNNIKNISK